MRTRKAADNGVPLTGASWIMIGMSIVSDIRRKKSQIGRFQNWRARRRHLWLLHRGKRWTDVSSQRMDVSSQRQDTHSSHRNMFQIRYSGPMFSEASSAL